MIHHLSSIHDLVKCHITYHRCMVMSGLADPVNAEELLRSALRMSFQMIVKKKKKTLIGNAVAISPTLALSALHGKAKKGDAIVLHSITGDKFKGTVAMVVFEVELVDIAVIELEIGVLFSCFTPVAVEPPVRYLEVVYIVGLKVNSRDDAMPAVYESKVNIIEPGERNALFQSSYVSFDSLSGAGVVVKKVGGVSKVVGVHVASHDSTTATPPVEKAEHTVDSAGFESVSVALASLSSNIHGHSAYTMVCEIARVPALIAFLRERKLC